ncbi:hypothetical protein ACM1RC_28830 [Paenibacillus azoreducens]|uniref:hypothetical protein n=1 Tax=Paenibacillus azoreducens TaxID=116718 RepID=UPI0039F58C38
MTSDVIGIEDFFGMNTLSEVNLWEVGSLHVCDLIGLNFSESISIVFIVLEVGHNGRAFAVGCRVAGGNEAKASSGSIIYVKQNPLVMD